MNMINIGEKNVNKLKTYSKITLFLSGISLIAILFSHFALIDIAHGEGNVSLEWTIVRITAVILLSFITLTIITLRQVLKMNL